MALKVALPEQGLVVGDVGAVVHVFKDGQSFMVEFTTFDRTTVAITKVSANQVRALAHNEINHARTFDAALR